MKNLGLNIYLLFVISWFLHLPARMPFLAVLRFDLLLVGILTILAFSSNKDSDSPKTQTDKLLRILIAYSILTIPFVEWPGSVVRFGIPNFIKAVVFYYFSVAFIRTEENLKKFIFVFLSCQVWRILEPLYLHVTVGYWGSVATMENLEFLDRLSGAPYDIVNPNGLAGIVCNVLPFIYFLSGLSWKNRLAFMLLVPLLLYALALTGSRSGLAGLIVIFLGILVKSKRRLFLALSGILFAVVGFSLLSPDQQDRYLSLFGHGEKNRGTAEGRVEGIEGDFNVILRRPIFGHGLGTSLEANANFRDTPQPSHNLYMEIGQELGFFGLIIFILFIKSIFSGFIQSQRVYSHKERTFLSEITDAMQVWLVMNFIFSFASYGLSSYDWYLFGGLSVVMQRLAGAHTVTEPRKLNSDHGQHGLPERRILRR